MQKMVRSCRAIPAFGATARCLDSQTSVISSMSVPFPVGRAVSRKKSNLFQPGRRENLPVGSEAARVRACGTR